MEMTSLQQLSPGAARGSLWAASSTLWWREMVRFFRQRNRVTGALLTPLVIWLLLGFGLGDSFSHLSQAGATDAAADGAATVDYKQYFFPGIVSMVLLFTAIFTTFSVIEDRREGFMQGILVAPVPRLAIVLGKVLGGATIATIQGAALLLIWPFLVDGPVNVLSMLLAIPAMFVFAMGLTGLGLCFAWPMDSTAGFHAIMNLILMPLWILSGAMFPVSKAPLAMKIIMWVNPVTYGQSVLSALMTDGQVDIGAPINLPLATFLMVSFTLLACLIAVRVVSKPRKDGT